MGRHAGDKGLNKSVAVIAAAVVALAGAGAAYALTSGPDEPEDSAASSVTTGAQQETAAEAPESQSSGETTAGAGEGGDAAEPSASDLTACIQQVEAAEKVATALAASAKSWRQHTTAQLKLDAGEFTREQTLAAWDESKARGAKDVQRYDAATAAAEDAAGGCEEVAGAGESAQDCVDRLAALDEVATSGGTVHEDWVAHQEMMADKAEMNGVEYAAMWKQMVTDSVATLKAYDESVAALDAAPACA